MARLPSILSSIPGDGVTIDALSARANEVLAEQGFVTDDGRAATRIDGRTVRFYQTLGVLPKPRYEGRRALYSTTHLLRLVAAKQLQSEGYSLAQIQATLPTRSDRQLLRAITGAAEGGLPVARAEAPCTSPPAWAGASPPSQLRAFTLAKGVTLLVDPSSTSDPESLASTLATTLARTHPPSVH